MLKTADYTRWKRKTTWRLNEAVALMLGIEPGQEIQEDDQVYSEYLDMLDTAKRSDGKDLPTTGRTHVNRHVAIYAKAEPALFLKWAQGKGYFVPKELEELIEPTKEQEQIVVVDNNPNGDSSLREKLEAAFNDSRMADDAAECDEARNMVLSIYFRLFAEEKELRKIKKSAERNGDSNAYHIAQSKLDLVTELLSVDGLKELAHLLDRPGGLEQSETGERIIIPIVEPKSKDDWFHVILDAVLAFEKRNGYTPSNTKLWSVLIKNPPDDYGIVFERKCLTLPDGSTMDRENFNKRYIRYFPANKP